MRRRGHGVAVMVTVVALGLAGCSGDDEGEGAVTPSGSAAAPSSADPSSGSGTGSSSVPGSAEAVSVARVVIPSALTFQRSENSTDPELDEVTWAATPPGAAVPTCRVILGVQSNYPGGLDAYRAYLRDVLGLTAISDDPKAPDGTSGVLASGSGGSGTAQDPTFRSALRTWVTSGGTKITISVAAASDADPACDPDAVAASLSWDGTDRPVSSAKPSA